MPYHFPSAVAVLPARPALRKNDLDILENLKTIIKEGQHEFYRAVWPLPLYMDHIPLEIPHPDQLQDYPSPDNVPFRSLTPVLALTLVSDRRA